MLISAMNCNEDTYLLKGGDISLTEEQELERQSIIQDALFTIEESDVEHILKNGQLEEFPDWENCIDLKACEELEDDDEEAQKENDSELDDTPILSPIPYQKTISLVVPAYDHAMSQEDMNKAKDIVSHHLTSLFADPTLNQLFSKQTFGSYLEHKYIIYEDDDMQSGYHITLRLNSFDLPIHK